MTLSVFEPVAYGAYWLSTPIGCLFPFPQLYTLFDRKSANISVGTMCVGLVAASLMSFNFAHEGDVLLTYRNVIQVWGFALILILKAYYDYKNAPVAGGSIDSSAWAATAVTAVTLGALTYFSSRFWLLPAAQLALWGDRLVMPSQILAGLGFAYFLLPKFLKIQRERSVGDSSKAMTLLYLCARLVALWALYKLAMLRGGAESLNAIVPILAYALLVAAAGDRVVRRLTRVQLDLWVSFLMLGAFMAGAIVGGYLLLVAGGAVADAKRVEFGLYLSFLTENIVASLLSVHTLAAFRRFAHA